MSADEADYVVAKAIVELRKLTNQRVCIKRSFCDFLRRDDVIGEERSDACGYIYEVSSVEDEEIK